jgi:dienelactone hydrolase
MSPSNREALLACLGQFPVPVPVNWAVERREVRDEVEYSRVTYDVAPDERVAAWLLRPVKVPGETSAPLAGVLAIHPHGGQYYLGKVETAGLAGNPDWRYGLELAQRGYAVMCPDLLGFEERRPLEYERMERPGSLQDRNYEWWLGHILAVQGSSLQARYVSDLSRALDVLAAQPDVNPDALGCLGFSGGGQETLWLTWYDERVKAAVSAGGVSLIETIIRNRIHHMVALWVPGLLQVGDLDTVVAGIAPRAYLLIHGETDPLFPLEGVQHIARVAQSAYHALGVPDRFALTTFAGGHVFPSEVRQVAYYWFDRWLKEGAV